MSIGHAGAETILKTLDIPLSRFAVPRCENLLRANYWARYVRWYAELYKTLEQFFEFLCHCKDLACNLIDRMSH
eukprot:10326394-Alexandrium_andersonii.AAC.1